MGRVTATEQLRKMLDERGVAYTVHGPRQTWFDHGEISVCAVEQDGTLFVAATALTPEQVIAATLGPTIVRCRDCEHACEIAGGGLACTLRSQMMHETAPDAFCSDGVRRDR